jgi:hypothetical protein
MIDPSFQAGKGGYENIEQHLPPSQASLLSAMV